MTQEHVDQLAAIEAKLEGLKDLVMNSLSIRAVGGVHIANELINVLPKLAEVKAAAEADVAAGAGA